MDSTSNSAKIDRAELRARLVAEFERTLDEVIDAVDNASIGHVIRQSEEQSRDALDRFRAVVYEAVLQARVDAAEAAFPPSEGSRDRKAAAS